MKITSLQLQIMTRLMLLALLLSAAGMKNATNAQTKSRSQNEILKHTLYHEEHLDLPNKWLCPDNTKTGGFETNFANFKTSATDNIGEAQNFPPVSLPLHDQLVDQYAYFNIIQTATLADGWNWCSFNVEITLDDLKDALVATGNSSIVIKSQTNGQTSYNGNIWRGPLNALDLTQMYKIKVATTCEMTLTGMPFNPGEHPATIQPGANWIAFPFDHSMTLADVFVGFPVSGDQIKSQSNGNAIYNGNNWRPTYSLIPGKGYIYNSAAEGTRTFTFPINVK